MLKNHCVFGFMFVVMFISLVFMAEYSYAQITSVEITANPELAGQPIVAGSEAIDLIAIAAGKDLTYEWQLLGPGTLDGNVNDMMIQYIPPKEVKKNTKGTLVLKVKDAEGNQQPVAIKFSVVQPPIPIIFPKLWPFPEPKISYKSSENNSIIIQGEHVETLGLTFEREMDLQGRNALEIEIEDLGNSAFRNDEQVAGSGDGIMLKVIIDGDEALYCDDSHLRAGDPEFVMRRVGKFEYSLEDKDSISKLGFIFYNAKLEGFKIRANFIAK